MIQTLDVERPSCEIKAQDVVVYRESNAYRIRQRALDVVISSAALVLTAPVMGIAALAIYCEDGGPIVFSQQRVGQYGRLFTIYKLRTMKKDRCEDALSPRASSDDRITSVGRYLRRFSIDEVPQFLNVLRGEMSLVGPRPEMPFIVRQYEGWQHCRHLRKPGITGLWQITCRSIIPLDRPEATKIDLEYVRTASTRTDGKIIFGTIAALLSAQGAL